MPLSPSFHSRAVDIDTEYMLSPEQIEKFCNDGYIKLKDVFNVETLAFFGAEIARVVGEKTKNKTALEERDAYGKAFLQVINFWRENEIVKEFVFGRRLARIATDLMSVTGVRLYQAQALFKEAGAGDTNMHVDQAGWPMADPLTVTAWIPLHAVPREQGPLVFLAGSHRSKIGLDLNISEKSEREINRALKKTSYPRDETPYDLGEVSFHLGYTLHTAGPNTSDRMREVMTIIYMDENMRLKIQSENQANDARQWCPGVREGEIIASPINPVLYSTKTPAPG